jgi:hypothetical protein
VNTDAPLDGWVQPELLPSDTGRPKAWYGLTPDVTDEEAKRQFKVKYGYEALEVHRDDACVRVGPIVEEETL